MDIRGRSTELCWPMIRWRRMLPARGLWDLTRPESRTSESERSFSATSLSSESTKSQRQSARQPTRLRWSRNFSTYARQVPPKEIPEMKANTKKAVDFPSRAATLAAETEGGSGSERAKAVLEKRSRPRLLSTLEGRTALSYADIGFFFVFVFFLAMMFRIGVHLHVLSQTRLDNPTLPFQITISLSLIGSLYAIIRLRHGRGAWKRLGWSWPARLHLVAALVDGVR